MSRIVFVICGHKIHDSRIVCTSDIGYMVLGNECFLLDGGVLSECQPPRWIHAFYGMFNSGLILMGYALYISLGLVQFLPLICGRLLADLDSSHAETTIINILVPFLRLLPRVHRRLPP